MSLSFESHWERVCLWSLQLLVLASPILAQNDQVSFSRPAIELHGEEPGFITSIAQDQIGNIWLSSNMGLMRYDGYETVAVDGTSKDSTFFDKTIEVLFCDHKGQIWIGNGLGLARYNPAEDRYYNYKIPNHRDGSADYVQDITEDRDGNLWILSGSSGLFKYEHITDQLTGFLNDPNESIHILDDNPRVILSDKNHNLWIGTGYGAPEDGQGLIRFNPKSGGTTRFLHIPGDTSSLFDNRVSALYENQSGQILIGTYQSVLHIYLPETETFKRMLYDPERPERLHAPNGQIDFWGFAPFIRIIHQDQRGGYWIGTPGLGLKYFRHPGQEAAIDFTREEGSTGSVLTSWTFLEDKQSNLWLGTMEGVLHRDLFEPLYRDIIDFPPVMDIYESPFSPGIIWLGTLEGLFKWNFQTNEVNRFIQESTRQVLFTEIRDVFQENDSIVWVGVGSAGSSTNPGGGRGGLVKLNQYTESITFFPITNKKQPGFHHTVFNIDMDHEGYLWICTGKALFRSNKSKTRFEEYKIPEVTSGENSYYYVTQKGANGKYWIMSQDNDEEGVLFAYNYEDERAIPFLEGYSISNIVEDDYSALWMSTVGKGILRFNTVDSTFARFTVEDGLPSDEWLFLLKDSTGLLWTNSNRGLAKIDPKSQEVSALKHEKNLKLQYGTLGGIVTSDDLILLELRNKIVVFQSSLIEGNPHPPTVKVNKFEVSETSIPINPLKNHTLSFSHEKNDIHIEYTGLHFSNPEDNIYKYQLEPLNDKWINAGTERNARYIDLMPGDYTFRVAAASNNGVLCKSTATIEPMSGI